MSQTLIHIVKELPRGLPEDPTKKPETNDLVTAPSKSLVSGFPVATSWKVVEPRRIELLTSCVQGRRSPS